MMMIMKTPPPPSRPSPPRARWPRPTRPSSRSRSIPVERGSLPGSEFQARFWCFLDHKDDNYDANDNDDYDIYDEDDDYDNCNGDHLRVVAAKSLADPL